MLEVLPIIKKYVTKKSAITMKGQNSIKQHLPSAKNINQEMITSGNSDGNLNPGEGYYIKMNIYFDIFPKMNMIVYGILVFL